MVVVPPNLKSKTNRDLFFNLKSLLNGCILELYYENSVNHLNIPEPDVNIQAVLELAAQLIAFPEGGFLDGVRVSIPIWRDDLVI